MPGIEASARGRGVRGLTECESQVRSEGACPATMSENPKSTTQALLDDGLLTDKGHEHLSYLGLADCTFHSEGMTRELVAHAGASINFHAMSSLDWVTQLGGEHD